MSLTLGRGPWSPGRAGRAGEQLPAHTAYLEPFLPRVRARVGGKVLVDSDRARRCTAPAR